VIVLDVGLGQGHFERKNPEACAQIVRAVGLDGQVFAESLEDGARHGTPPDPGGGFQLGQSGGCTVRPKLLDFG